MPILTVHPTHIEIKPYKKGENFPLEKSLSVWMPVVHRYRPIAYTIYKDTLYLPRGISVPMLESQFEATATYINETEPYDRMKRKYKMTAEPRDKIQEDSIEFLLSENRFYRGNFCTQFGLNLDTGDGKTYTMVNAIMQMNAKAIVITHKDRIKQQWKDTFLNMTDIEPCRILDIDSSTIIEKLMIDSTNQDFDIYLVNQQTLAALARKFNWDAVTEFFKYIKVGIKVVDEAHKFFENSLKIDMFTNVNRSYYLTATFARSSEREEKIFKTAYSNLMRFGEETGDYDGKRKYIVMIPVKYRSHPMGYEELGLNTIHGFSSYKFIDYALNEENRSMERVLGRIITKCKDIEGRTLITVPKIDATERVAKIVREYTDETVATVNSKNNPKDNIWATHNADIIVSTTKGFGEGDDVKGLRKLINLEPIGSKVLASQLRGRLREYAPDKDSYLFYLVDTSIGKVYEFYKKILPVMVKKCSEIMEMELNDI